MIVRSLKLPPTELAPKTGDHMPPQSSFTHRPPRAWHKISINVPSQFAETAAALMASLTTSGIEQNCAAPGQPDGDREEITAYIPEDQNPTSVISTIHDFLNTLNKKIVALPPASLTQELIIEEDWNSRWKEHFKPFKLTNRLVIKPSWEDYNPQPEELVLEMDPGMAFGTGLHASTRLALQLIDELFTTNPPTTVLDIGTGTGILGMNCALLGAKKVIGIDNDIDAQTAATENILNNRLDSVMNIDQRDLSEIDGRFELVIANITQDVLTLLAPNIMDRLAPAGRVVLSGILTGAQTEAIKTLYSSLGLTVTKENPEGEWTALLLTQANDPG